MDGDARPGRAWAEQHGPPRGHWQGVFFVVGVLARAMKHMMMLHIFLPRTDANSCCGVHASRGTGSRRPRLGKRPPLATHQGPLVQ